MQVVGGFKVHLHGPAHEYRRGLGLFPQKSRHAAALVVLDELAGELLLQPLALFAAGQQQIAFHLHKPRRHFYKGAGAFRVGVGLRHGLRILVDELQDGNIVQVHLVFGHERQKQFQRAVEIFQMEGQFSCHAHTTVPMLE